MGEPRECRQIPDFPDYAICDNGDIVNKRLNHRLRPNARIGKVAVTESVNLRKDGKSYHMGVKKLYREVYPEWDG